MTPEARRRLLAIAERLREAPRVARQRAKEYALHPSGEDAFIVGVLATRCQLVAEEIEQILADEAGASQ